MRQRVLLGLVVAASGLLATPAVARDAVSRTVEVRVVLSGNVSSVYDPEPPAATIAIGYYGTYAGSWSWTQTETTTYRRQPAGRGGAEYADRTVIRTSATITESSSIVSRAGLGPGRPSCAEAGGTETVNSRRVEKGRGADPPDPRFPFAVSAGSETPTSCGGADHAPQGAFPGMGLERVCVWTCVLPAGRRTSSVSVPAAEHNSGLGRHVHSASFAVSVVTSTQRPGVEKKVRHRWQPDF